MELSDVKPLIGSHNSMSYLEPIGKFGKMTKLLYRCQRKTIREQYLKYGVRVFDFRLFFNDAGRCYFKHGPVWFESFSLFEHLGFLDNQGDCMVRIVLEETLSDKNRHNISYIEERFKTICKIIETIYTHVKFFGGFRLYDSEVLYKFNHKSPIIYEATSPWPLIKLVPLWNAKEENHKALSEKTVADCILMDFVDIK